MTATLTVYPIKSRYRWVIDVHDKRASPREIQSPVSYGSEAEARRKGEEAGEGGRFGVGDAEGCAGRLRCNRLGKPPMAA
jgi:hypothetical protein